MKMQHQKIVVAMSGGVDSSVAAAILVSQGYDVTGIMMRLWSEPGKEASNRCCTPDAMAMARRVAAHLGIPFYALDAQAEFRKSVVEYFLEGYTQNKTPNPCLMCNKHIRWDYLYNHAMNLGADALATGHYVRSRVNPAGKFELLCGIDANKDQSYILHILSQEKLAHAHFPVGDYTKPQIREIARKYNLPVADRAESQDLCFLAGGDYRGFLSRHAPDLLQPGEIVNTNGEVIGKHDGLAFYTIGQRKGMRLASPDPLYVIEKETLRNRLVVGKAHELGQRELIAVNINWISGELPQNSFRAQIKIRYKSHLEWGVVQILENGSFRVRFDRLIRDITPGQAVVIYDNELCLGGGIIEKGLSHSDG